MILGTVRFERIIPHARLAAGMLLAPSPFPEPTQATQPQRVKRVPLPVRTPRPPRIELPALSAPPVLALQPAPTITLPPAEPRVPTVVTGSFHTPEATTAPTPTATAIATGSFSSVARDSRAPSIPTGSVSQIGAFSAISTTVAERTTSATIESSGFGTAQSGADRRGGGTVVASTGFGAPSGHRPGKSGAPQTTAPSGFDTPQYTAPTAPSAAVTASASLQSVEIITKPKPEYTEEARKRRVEGEVWLEVLFGADGMARIQRVLRSLGYGLDENAITATRQIRFRPARDGSQAVDQIATIRVQFQLAE